MRTPLPESSFQFVTPVDFMDTQGDAQVISL